MKFINPNFSGDDKGITMAPPFFLISFFTPRFRLKTSRLQASFAARSGNPLFHDFRQKLTADPDIVTFQFVD